MGQANVLGSWSLKYMAPLEEEENKDGREISIIERIKRTYYMLRKCKKPRMSYKRNETK